MLKKIILIVMSALIVFSFSACGKKEADFSEIKAICELATLKCYYHNTSELRQESTGIGKYLGKIGYKKAWIEYDGIVKLGIDASLVRIEPDGNTVKVYVPAATILSTDVDVESITESVSETGWFTKITTEERADTQKAAQDDMRTKAEGNTALLLQASQRAKTTIRDYITNVGNLIGVEYQIEWMEK